MPVEISNIFLNALVGISTPETMRVVEKLSKTLITILIDSGSTHNFLHESFDEVLGLHIEVNSALRVIVANGARIQSLGLFSKVKLNLSDSLF